MNPRTWSRILLAAAFSVSGLVETLSATGLVVELSPDGRWLSGIHTLAVSGPLQLVGAALLALGRKTRWTLLILGGYVFLAGVFGNLPLIFHPEVGGTALAGLLINLAIMGGIVYGLYSERSPGAHRATTALPIPDPAPALQVGLPACQELSGSQTLAPGPVTSHMDAPQRRSGGSHRIGGAWEHNQRLWRASGIDPGAGGFHSHQHRLPARRSGPKLVL